MSKTAQLSGGFPGDDCQGRHVPIRGFGRSRVCASALASASGAATAPAAANRVRDRRQHQMAASAAGAGAGHLGPMGHITLSGDKGDSVVLGPWRHGLPLLSLRLNLYLHLFADSDAAPVTAPDFNPGLRGRFEITANSSVTDRPRSAHFPEGQQFRSGNVTAPPENDLGGLRRQPRLDC